MNAKKLIECVDKRSFYNAALTFQKEMKTNDWYNYLINMDRLIKNHSNVLIKISLLLNNPNDVVKLIQYYNLENYIDNYCRSINEVMSIISACLSNSMESNKDKELISLFKQHDKGSLEC